MTVSRPASLAKIEDINFDQDLVSVRQEMKRIVASARKAADTGVAFALTKQELDWTLESINVADAGEYMLAGFKSLMIHLWFEGQRDKPEGEKKGSAWLEGHLNTPAETIRSLRSIGQIRWQCELQGLPLKLFSNVAVRGLRPLMNDPNELGRKYHKIVSAYWEERERVKEVRKVETGRYPTRLPKYITSTDVQLCLEASEDDHSEVCEASHTPGDINKADSGHSNSSTSNNSSDDLDDPNDDRIDDRQLVLRLLGDAEEAAEALVRRFPKHQGVVALGSSISRVYEQASGLELSMAQLNKLWSARR